MSRQQSKIGPIFLSCLAVFFSAVIARSQTTQQRVWQKRAIGTLVLNLRTVIAVAAEGLPITMEATKKWITDSNGS